MGRIQYEERRQWMDQRGYSLTPTFVFIDGRTGAQLYQESFKEEVLYPTAQNTPALSAYFELMDKMLPGFLNTLSTQRIRGTQGPREIGRRPLGRACCLPSVAARCYSYGVPAGPRIRGRMAEFPVGAFRHVCHC